MNRELTCIVCPNGCRITVAGAPGSLQISGQRCPRGAAYAQTELTHPMRSLTTTVRTSDPAHPALPVRTGGEIPKERLFDALRALSAVCIAPPVAVGDVVYENLCGTGVSVVATSDLQ